MSVPKQNWICNMKPEWEKVVLSSKTFGVPDNRPGKSDIVQDGDQLFLYVSGTGGGIVGVFTALGTFQKDTTGQFPKYSNRIKFVDKIRSTSPIPFRIFKHEVFQRFAPNWSNALFGKTLILISEENAKYLENLISNS